MKNILIVISVLFLTACNSYVDAIQIEKLNTICEANGSKAHWYDVSNQPKSNNAMVTCANGSKFSEIDYQKHSQAKEVK